MAVADLDAQIGALADMNSRQLKARWQEMTSTVAPLISPAMLRLALAWEIQARALGGLPRKTQQMIQQLGAAKTRTRPAQPGMRLVREWNGVAHVVTVDEDKIIRWNDREWGSLSAVARSITGTRWSGPAFFGLKQKVAP